MQNVFEQATESRGKVTTEYTRAPRHFGMTKGEIEAEILRDREDPSWGIVSTASLRETIIQKSDNSEGYLRSWRQWSQSSPERLWLSESQHTEILDYLGSPFVNPPTVLARGLK